MNGTKISREGSRHLAELRTGVEAKLNNNLAMWGNVGVQIGDKGYSDTQGMLGGNTVGSIHSGGLRDVRGPL
ncbi:hypothetical protein EA14781_016_00240 [Escherichia albertii NBRC 107761 = DSM 17582]|nr:hypothetical protein EA14781_016_00240 [Escherichia albertii NBRC 107761 = DSM 17582]